MKEISEMRKVNLTVKAFLNFMLGLVILPIALILFLVSFLGHLYVYFKYKRSVIKAIDYFNRNLDKTQKIVYNINR